MYHTDLLSIDALLNRLSTWVEAGWIRPLDEGFARFLVERGPEATAAPSFPLVILGAALASHQLGRGHACLDLEKALSDPETRLGLPPVEGKSAAKSLLTSPLALLTGVSLADWQAALASAPAYVDTAPQVGLGASPLVCVGPRLYLRRYWAYEQTVAKGIAQRLQDPLPVNESALKAALSALFPAAATKPDLQKVACAMAARQRFFILTGGPGTGKTTTVVKLLAVLQSLSLTPKDGRPLRIHLAAPTGKAAARLSDAIGQAITTLESSAHFTNETVLKALPREVTTVHRLLGSRPDTRHFRHHAHNLLRLDVLVIDEASMVDLEKMACVMAALPPTARLILVGDKDQLVSVEAGSVLGELCQRADKGHYTSDTLEAMVRLTGENRHLAWEDPHGTRLDQAILALKDSFRFPLSGPIGQLAQAVNQGDATKAKTVFSEHGRDPTAPLTLLRITHPKDEAFKTLILEKRGSASDCLSVIKNKRPDFGKGKPTQAQIDDWAREVLSAHSAFQLLCVLRKGRFGVEGLNARITDWLREEGAIDHGEWYEGRPVMVTQNDYSLGLMNGDIGITLNIGHATDPDRRVAFTVDGAVKWVRPGRLQAVETVYALTVHKSQGSEFMHTALILPPVSSAILTRELLYTGITRTQKTFTLIQTQQGEKADVLEHTIAQRVMRSGGLLDALHTHGGEPA